MSALTTSTTSSAVRWGRPATGAHDGQPLRRHLESLLAQALGRVDQHRQTGVARVYTVCKFVPHARRRRTRHCRAVGAVRHAGHAVPRRLGHAIVVPGLDRPRCRRPPHTDDPRDALEPDQGRDRRPRRLRPNERRHGPLPRRAVRPGRARPATPRPRGVDAPHAVQQSARPPRRRDRACPGHRPTARPSAPDGARPRRARPHARRHQQVVRRRQAIRRCQAGRHRRRLVAGHGRRRGSGHRRRTPPRRHRPVDRLPRAQRTGVDALVRRLSPAVSAS